MAVSEVFKLLVNNLVTAPVTTISTNQPVLVSLNNLKNTNRQKVVRLGGVANVQLTYDLGSAQNVSAFALVGTNLRNGATIELRHSTDNFAANNILLTTLTYSKPTSITGGHAVEWVHFYLFDSLSKRYWRTVSNDVGNPDSYTDFGVMGWFPAVEFTRNMDYGWNLRVVDPSETIRSVGGVPHSDRRKPWREFSCDVKFLSSAESWATFFPLMLQLGTSQDFFVVPFPLATDGLQYAATLYGRFVSGPGLTAEITQIKTYSSNQIVIAESL